MQNEVLCDVVTVEYELEDEIPVIYIFARGVDRKRYKFKDESFRPYYYVLAEEANRAPTDLSIFGEQLVRIDKVKPADVRKERKRWMRTFEADIPFTRRYMIDRKLYCGLSAKSFVSTKKRGMIGDKWILSPAEFHDIPLRYWCFDLEVNCPPEYIPDASKAVYNIVSIVIYDTYDEEHTIFAYHPHDKEVELSDATYKHYAKEREMLNAFLEFLEEKDPDVLTGWNINLFDIPYLINRMRKLNVNFKKMSPMRRVYMRGGFNPESIIKGRVVFDAFKAYSSLQNVMGRLESYTLTYVYEFEFGHKKMDYGDQIRHLWENEFDNLIKYNLSDVVATWALIKKKRLIPFYNIFRAYVGCPLSETFTYSKMTDILLLREAKKRGVVLPDKPRGVVSGDLRGAVVYEPTPGIHLNVATFDLANLYPSIITAANISAECITEEGDIKLGPASFIKSPMGFLPSILQDLIGERNRLKKKMFEFEVGSPEYELAYTHQFAIKFFICSVYGYCGFPRARLFDLRLANSITWLGRTLTHHTRDVVQSKFGYPVIYGDTDSVFVKLPEHFTKERVIEEGFRIEEELNRSYGKLAKDLGIEVEGALKVKFEKIFSPYFMKESKKTYAGKLVWREGHDADVVMIVGMAPRRSDNARVTRDVLRELLKALLDLDEAKAKRIVREAWEGFEEYPLIDIGIPKGIQQSLYSYKTPSPWVRGARFLNKEFGGRLAAGSKPKLFYLKRAIGSHEYFDVIAIERFDWFFRKVREETFRDAIDWQMMKEKTLKDKAVPILEAVGIDWIEILTGTKQITLEAFT